MKKIAIIGAGYTGMIAAKELIKKGYEVTIFESSDSVGGMTATFDAYGTKLEYFYRHIFKSDKYVINLIKELGIENELIWPKTQMGYFMDNNLFEFGTAISLLKFKPLNLIQKFQFGMSIIKIKLIKDYKKLETISAYEWLMKNAGKTAYEKVWEPLLVSKFGDKYKTISMAWMWGKIVLRGSSGDKDGERLGYLNGSYQILTDALERNLIDNKVVFYKKSLVEKVVSSKNKFNIKLSDKTEYKGFDKVISTVAYPIFTKIAGDLLNKNEIKKLNKIEYTAARIMVLFLKKSFMKFYWLNVGSKDIPFGGLIEHTNMIDKVNYNNKHVLYISNYMFENDELYNIPNTELLKRYIPLLKKINKNFDEKDIERFEVFKEKYAQPLIVKEYSKIKPDFKTSKSGLYIASMPQIYPEDRGLNYAIKFGEEVSKIV